MATTENNEVTQEQIPGFLSIATERTVAMRAARIAFIVGIVLALINHGNHLVSGNINFETISKIALTFMVPYCVSTWSSVLAVRDRLQSTGSDTSNNK
ncbi:MAG: nitrate/nitrite transporter NrtS [Roseobacter sp.]